MKPDIGSASWFLPTPPEFDAPIRGVPIGMLSGRLVWKNLNGVATRRRKNLEDIFIRFNRMYKRDGRIDTA